MNEDKTKPIRIPTDLHTALKSKAALAGEGLGEMVTEQLRKIAGNSSDRRKARRAGK